MAIIDPATLFPPLVATLGPPVFSPSPPAPTVILMPLVDTLNLPVSISPAPPPPPQAPPDVNADAPPPPPPPMTTYSADTSKIEGVNEYPEPGVVYSISTEPST